MDNQSTVLFLHEIDSQSLETNEFISFGDAKILVVDDNLVNLSVMEGLLQLCNINPDCAMSGFEAIERLESNHYDLVFMDHMMPGIDGIETVKKIRQSGLSADKLPVVALSANISDEYVFSYTEAGMQDFMSKPIDKFSLRNILQKWLPKELISDRESRKLALDDFLAKMHALRCLDTAKGLEKADGSVEKYKSELISVSKNLSKITRLLLCCDTCARIETLAFAACALLVRISADPYIIKLATEIELNAKRYRFDLCEDKISEFVTESNTFTDAVSNYY